VRYAYESEAVSWGKRAETEARRALEQDSSLGEAHLAIGSAAGTLYRGFDWKTVMSESATALALDPSLELAHIARMRAFYHLGLFDSAREEAQRARALNPTPNIELARLEVAVELFGGDFKKAADQAAALLPRTDAPAIRHYLGLARFYLKDVTGAREVLAGTMRGGKPDVRAQASLASVEAAAGLRKEARARILAIERGSYMDHHVAYSLGAAWAQLGDAATSIRWLQQAVDTGFPCYPWFAKDTLLDPVRSAPGFRELIARLEAQHRASSR
jgi:tetratricopeptide (TPR) repeat protein